MKNDDKPKCRHDASGWYGGAWLADEDGCRAPAMLPYRGAFYCESHHPPAMMARAAAFTEARRQMDAMTSRSATPDDVLAAELRGRGWVVTRG